MLAGLDGVACSVGALRSAVEGASTTDVRASVQRQLRKQVKKLGTLARTARKSGRRGAKALTQLERKLSALVGTLEKLRGDKIAAPLGDRLLALARSGAGAVRTVHAGGAERRTPGIVAHGLASYAAARGGRAMPSRILVVYYSMYGHVETMAHAEAEGARTVGDVEVAVKRVPDLVPEDIARAAGAKLDQPAPLATPDELPEYDGILFGTPTRFGNMAAQMRNFLDRTGKLWAKGALVGKVGSVFTSTATQHGGQETTITSFHTTLLHHGMVVVGVPYTCPELSVMSEPSGGTPYGASTLAGPDGSRRPSANELAVARFQGRHVATLTTRLRATAA